MVALVSVKNYLSLARIKPGLPPVVGMLRVMLEGYLSSWTSINHMGIPTYEEKITFDGASVSWSVFRIEITGILIKHGLLLFLSFASVGGSGVTPPHLYFWSTCMGAVINMAVNNSLIEWPIYEGNKDGVDL